MREGLEGGEKYAHNSSTRSRRAGTATESDRRRQELEQKRNRESQGKQCSVDTRMWQHILGEEERDTVSVLTIDRTELLKSLLHS